MADLAIKVRGLSKSYGGRVPVAALTGVDLDVAPGETVAILGASGAGKSTLLNVLGLLDTPDSGSYEVFGAQTSGLSGWRRDRIRAQVIGFVFQAYHVLGHRTVRENILLKLTTVNSPAQSREQLVAQAAEAVGLTDHFDALGATLSGGEKQRLAVARAIVGEPQILLADEPTGNLDGKNAETVLALFAEQAKKGVAVVVITHDLATANWADRTVLLESGQIHE